MSKHLELKLGRRPKVFPDKTNLEDKCQINPKMKRKAMNAISKEPRQKIVIPNLSGNLYQNRSLCDTLNVISDRRLLTSC
jgi:hypothetical protein